MGRRADQGFSDHAVHGPLPARQRVGGTRDGPRGQANGEKEEKMADSGSPETLCECVGGSVLFRWSDPMHRLEREGISICVGGKQKRRLGAMPVHLGTVTVC